MLANYFCVCVNDLIARAEHLTRSLTTKAFCTASECADRIQTPTGLSHSFTFTQEKFFALGFFVPACVLGICTLIEKYVRCACKSKVA